VDADISSQGIAPDWDHSLIVSSDVVDYPDTDVLFTNVQHEMLNRSIVIKSVVEE
jgi:hypothetical protein